MSFFDGMGAHDKLILAGMLISGFVLVFGMLLFSKATVNVLGKVQIGYKEENKNGG